MPPFGDTMLRERPHDGLRWPSPLAAPQPAAYVGQYEPEPTPATEITVADDGSVTVREHKPDSGYEPSGEFDENLAERDELSGALTEIGYEVLEGIEADISSRQGWISNYTKGLDLLGLKIEQGSNTKGQKRNLSRSRDTTLLETIVKAQAQARGELLPAAGPAKIQETPGATEQDDSTAADFEDDFNLTLTKGMPEYVPGLDKSLFSFFYSGNMFRYGYHCPILGRPVVETYPTEDLIVSEEATSLDTATRVTMRTPAMAPSEVRRRQFRKQWRDIPLSSTMPDTTPEGQKLQEISGVRQMSVRQKDQPYCIYRTITDLDLAVYGLQDEEVKEERPVPYLITIERYSREVLRIERYWNEGDTRYLRKRRLIHYSMVPGFGFLSYGFLHLQGNQVQALTAIVRLLIDAMMFSCFPGGAKAKGARTETNELNPGPGEFVEVGVPGGIDDIRKVLMSFPYKDLSPVAIQFYNLLQQNAKSVGAAAMLEVGEGRANIPVGTIMAMLEEKSIVMSAIHKRMHAAMSQELTMIRELFMERPETLAQVCPNPKRIWAEAAEFADLDLVPASDPNVPSQVHRIMLATALATLLSMPAVAPMLDPVDILKRIMRMIGISDADNVVHPAQQQQQGPDPVVTAAQATLTAKQIDAQSKQEENQRKAANDAITAQQKEQQSQRDAANDALDQASKERIAGMKEDTERLRLASEEKRAVATLINQKHETALDHLNNAANRQAQMEGSEADRQTQMHTAQTAADARQFGGSQL